MNPPIYRSTQKPQHQFCGWKCQCFVDDIRLPHSFANVLKCGVFVQGWRVENLLWWALRFWKVLKVEPSLFAKHNCNFFCLARKNHEPKTLEFKHEFYCQVVYYKTSVSMEPEKSFLWKEKTFYIHLHCWGLPPLVLSREVYIQNDLVCKKKSM